MKTDKKTNSYSDNFCAVESYQKVCEKLSPTAFDVSQIELFENRIQNSKFQNEESNCSKVFENSFMFDSLSNQQTIFSKGSLQSKAIGNESMEDFMKTIESAIKYFGNGNN